MPRREIVVAYSFGPEGEGVCSRCKRWQQETWSIECADHVMSGPDGYPSQFCGACLEKFKRGLRAGARRARGNDDR